MKEIINLPVLKAVVESAQSNSQFSERLSRLLCVAFQDGSLDEVMYALLEGVCVDLDVENSRGFSQLQSFLQNRDKSTRGDKYSIEIERIEVGPLFSTVHYEVSENRWYDNQVAADDFAKHGSHPNIRGKWGVNESPMFGYIYPATHKGRLNLRMSNVELEELGIHFIKV